MVNQQRKPTIGKERIAVYAIDWYHVVGGATSYSLAHYFKDETIFHQGGALGGSLSQFANDIYNELTQKIEDSSAKKGKLELKFLVNEIPDSQKYESNRRLNKKEWRYLIDFLHKQQTEFMKERK